MSPATVEVRRKSKPFQKAKNKQTKIKQPWTQASLPIWPWQAVGHRKAFHLRTAPVLRVSSPGGHGRAGGLRGSPRGHVQDSVGAGNFSSQFQRLNSQRREDYVPHVKRWLQLIWGFPSHVGLFGSIKKETQYDYFSFTDNKKHFKSYRSNCSLEHFF